MLAASVYIEIDTIRSTGSGAARLVEGQRSTLQLIDEIQREEDSLSAVFYELAANTNPANRGQLLGNLERIEQAIRQTMDAGLRSGDPKALGRGTGSRRAVHTRGTRRPASCWRCLPLLRSHEAHRLLAQRVGRDELRCSGASAATRARRHARASAILAHTAGDRLNDGACGAVFTVRIVSRCSGSSSGRLQNYRVFRRERWRIRRRLLADFPGSCTMSSDKRSAL